MDTSLSSPRPVPAPDPLRRLWGPLTIRVAWDLLRAGVEVRAPTLRAARDHALWRLPPGAGLAEAEATASAAVEDYLARTAGRYVAFERDPDLDILPTPAWRQGILAASEPIHEAVLRLHYADGLSLEDVEARTRLDAALLRGAREAVRELAREIVTEDGVSLDGWEPARLDRLIVRTATAAGDMCPGPGGLATEAGRAHADDCPRCSRALRMFREGVLSPGDLFPPEDGACLPSATLDLACLHVHPDARRHARSLARALGDAARILADDLLLVDAARVDLPAVLVDAAERGAPAAAQLRVARRVVPARWAPRAIVGPGPDDLLARVQRLAWGEVDGMDPLPEPLPPPPSAARWWAAAALVGLLALAAGVWALRGGGETASYAIEASWQPDGLLFDTDEAAWVDLVALRGGRAELAFHSEHAGDKGELATGDGRYRLAAAADAYVVVASPKRVEGIERVLEVYDAAAERPADALAERLRERYPGTSVRSVP